MEDENYYPEPEDQNQVSEEKDAPAEEGQENALLPRSIFQNPDLKVGDTCTFKVTRIYDDEVEVVYNKSEEKTEDEPEEMTPEQKLDEMAM